MRIAGTPRVLGNKLCFIVTDANDDFVLKALALFLNIFAEGLIPSKSSLT